MTTRDDDAADLLIAASRHNAALARRGLDVEEPTVDRVKHLPRAEQRMVHDKPDLLPTGTPVACRAEARVVEEAQNLSVAVPLTFAVSCRMPRGHRGTHIAGEQWQWHKTWAVWAWEEVPDRSTGG